MGASAGLILLIGAKSENVPMIAAVVVFLAFGVWRWTPRTPAWTGAWIASGVMIAAVVTASFAGADNLAVDAGD